MTGLYSDTTRLQINDSMDIIQILFSSKLNVSSDIYIFSESVMVNLFHISLALKGSRVATSDAGCLLNQVTFMESSEHCVNSHEEHYINGH